MILTEEIKLEYLRQKQILETQDALLSSDTSSCFKERKHCGLLVGVSVKERYRLHLHMFMTETLLLMPQESCMPHLPYYGLVTILDENEKEKVKGSTRKQDIQCKSITVTSILDD